MRRVVRSKFFRVPVIPNEWLMPPDPSPPLRGLFCRRFWQVSDRMRCTKCNRDVIRLSGVKWTKNVHYMQFREVFPNQSKLRGDACKSVPLIAEPALMRPCSRACIRDDCRRQRLRRLLLPVQLGSSR